MTKARILLKRIDESYDPFSEKAEGNSDVVKNYLKSSGYRITNTDEKNGIIGFANQNGKFLLHYNKNIPDGNKPGTWMLIKPDLTSPNRYYVYDYKNKKFSQAKETLINKCPKLNQYIKNNYSGKPKPENNYRELNVLISCLNGDKKSIQNKLKQYNYEVVDKGIIRDAFTVEKNGIGSFSIAKNKRNEWKLARHMGNTSDYEIYDEGTNSWYQATDKIKNENPELTNYIRNFNTKQDIKNKSREFIDDANKSLGQTFGTMLGGDLGGYLGKKYGSALADKINTKLFPRVSR